MNNKTLKENISKVEDVKDRPLKKQTERNRLCRKRKHQKTCINILRDTREYIAFMEQ